jgi:hypothetical protein
MTEVLRRIEGNARTAVDLNLFCRNIHATSRATLAIATCLSYSAQGVGYAKAGDQESKPIVAAASDGAVIAGARNRAPQIRALDALDPYHQVHAREQHH